MQALQSADLVRLLCSFVHCWQASVARQANLVLCLGVHVCMLQLRLLAEARTSIQAEIPSSR